MDINKQPGIKADAIFLKDINFSRQPTTTSTELEIKFNLLKRFSEDKKHLECELAVEVTDKSKAIELKCTMIGIFSTILALENLELEEFADKNAPALILPYIRELVASTTMRAGMPTLIIPPINIIAMLQNKKETILMEEKK